MGTESGVVDPVSVEMDLQDLSMKEEGWRGGGLVATW
jgi:hypothetical protein